MIDVIPATRREQAKRSPIRESSRAYICQIVIWDSRLREEPKERSNEHANEYFLLFGLNTRRKFRSISRVWSYRNREYPHPESAQSARPWVSALNNRLVMLESEKKAPPGASS